MFRVTYLTVDGGWYRSWGFGVGFGVVGISSNRVMEASGATVTTSVAPSSSSWSYLMGREGEEEEDEEEEASTLSSEEV
jgi:hypothetical protein